MESLAWLGLAWLGSAWLGSGLVVAVVCTLLDSRAREERKSARVGGKTGRGEKGVSEWERGYRGSALDVSGCAVRRYKSQWHTLCSDCQRMPFDFNPPTTAATATTESQDFYRRARASAPRRASTRPP